MSVPFTESFENTGSMKWGDPVLTFGVTAPVVSSGGGARTGSYYGQTGSFTVPAHYFSTNERTSDTFVVGLAAKPSTNWAFTIYNDPTPTSYNTQTSYTNITRSGLNWRIDIGSGSLALLFPSPAFGAAYAYLEVKIKYHATAGTVQVWQDGLSLGIVTGINTLGTGAASASSIAYFCDTYYGNANRVDDIYCVFCDGVDVTDVLGPVRIESLVPAGNGASSGWLGSDGNSVNNYQLVDDNDDTTDYVAASASGTEDTYVHSDSAFPTSLSVVGCMVYVEAEKDDAGAVGITTLARLGGLDDPAIEPDRGLYNGTYVYFHGWHPTKPGGGAWTVADVNNAEFGYKVA